MAEFFAERQLLIADGHHRYETALAYAAEQGDTEPRLLAVLVSSDDPGLEILATHRVFSGRPDLLPEGEPYPSVAAGLEGSRPLRSIARRRSSTGTGRRPSLSASLASSDVELVDRAGLEGISYTVDAGEAVALVDAGEADCACLIRPTPIHDLFDRARADRGDAAEGDALLPEAHVRSALPPARAPVTDWLAFSRACVADLELALESLPTRVEREPVLRAGEGGDDTTAIDAAAEAAVVARLEGSTQTSCSSRRSSGSDGSARAVRCV